MTIETKHHLEEQLFFLGKDQKIKALMPWRIDAEIKIDQIKVSYWFEVDGKFEIVDQSLVYHSREALIESL